MRHAQGAEYRVRDTQGAEYTGCGIHRVQTYLEIASVSLGVSESNMIKVAIYNKFAKYHVKSFIYIFVCLYLGES